eukprot:TRINITY_DN561_c0_g2_i12.p2 TRINITY_DN561_c0_g2~~TRINITY_DN561_c0_g2_i12.p2  ORF type:complete len:103 (-),score=20.87 TRINITY_DN561_c0_g2_i12:1171-1479(-)
MVELDADKKKLETSSGEKAKRDIVQFVQLNALPGKDPDLIAQGDFKGDSQAVPFQCQEVCLIFTRRIDEAVASDTQRPFSAFATPLRLYLEENMRILPFATT